MPDDPTGILGAADRIRETAKWLTVSMAALGGVLVAGSSLSSIGKLNVGSSRFELAIAGGFLSALGAVSILLAVAWTATAPSVSLESLNTGKPPGTEKVVADPSLLGGYSNINELRDEYVNALTARKSAQVAHLNAPGDAAKLTAIKVADGRLTFAHGIGIELLTVVSYKQLSRRWHWSEFWIVLGGVVAAAGVGIFVWAANPPAPTVASAAAVASAATPGVLTSPVAGKLTLTREGVRAVRGGAGDRCKIHVPLSVLVLGKTDLGPDLMINQPPNCKPVRLVVGPSWGAVRE